MFNKCYLNLKWKQLTLNFLPAIVHPQTIKYTEQEREKELKSVHSTVWLEGLVETQDHDSGFTGG